MRCTQVVPKMREDKGSLEEIGDGAVFAFSIFAISTVQCSPLKERFTMRKLILSAAVAAAFASPVTVSTAQAQAAAAPASPHTITGNMTIGSDYRFRGVSQTFRGPTIQGGVDYSHTSGLYVGNWNSNVSGLTFTNGNNIEMDFYGGWKKSWGDWGLDIGGLYYYYDSARWNSFSQQAAANTAGVANNMSGNYNNGEIYIGGSWKWLSAKYSHSLTNYFGIDGAYARTYQAKDCFMAGGTNGTANATCAAVNGVARNGFLGANNENRGDSKGSGYFQIDASYEFAPKWTVVGHVGKLSVKNYSELNYTDYKVGVTYDWSGWMISGAVIGTNANKQWYAGTRTIGGVAQSKDLGTSTVVLSVTKTF